MKIEFINIPNLNLETLELIYEIRKQIEMQFALSKELLGIDKEQPTAKEVKILLITNAADHKGGG